MKLSIVLFLLTLEGAAVSGKTTGRWRIRAEPSNNLHDTQDNDADATLRNL